MGRYFSTTSRLQCDTVPLTDGPVTLVAWVYRIESAIGRILGLDVGTGYTGISIRTNGTLPNLYVGNKQTNLFINALTLNTWEMVTGTFVGGTGDGFIHRNEGGGDNSASTVLMSVSGTIDRIQISRTSDFGFNGGVAHACIYKKVISNTERIALYNGGKGMDPRYVAPTDLVAYWPLVSNDLDVVGSYNFTAYNDPTFVTSPTIWLPSENDMAKGASQPLPPPARRQFMI